MNETEFEVSPEPEIVESLKPVIVDPHAARRFVVGKFGSLAETMGYDEAEAFLEEHSLTRHARREAARRRARPILRSRPIEFS